MRSGIADAMNGMQSPPVSIEERLREAYEAGRKAARKDAAEEATLRAVREVLDARPERETVGDALDAEDGELRRAIGDAILERKANPRPPKASQPSPPDATALTRASALSDRRPSAWGQSEWGQMDGAWWAR